MKFFKSTGFFYLAVFGLIEMVVRLDFVSVALLPAPSQILKVFIEQPELILSSFYRTSLIATVAFFISSCFGFLLALTLHQFPGALSKVTPITLFFQTVPIIAIAPLLVIYFGFGLPVIFAAAIIVCFFPVFAATQIGLTQVKKNQSELFFFLRARRWQKLIYLEVPSAVPIILAGLKTSAGLSVVGVVSGEFMSGGGLGALIDSARMQQRVDLIFASLICLSLLGLALMKGTEFIFRLLFKAYLAKI